MRLKLTVIRSSDDELRRGKEMEFLPPGFVIGRSKNLSVRPAAGREVGIRVPHDSVSRKHAEFLFEQATGTWIVRNFSQNGTIVDGVLLEPEYEAEISDVSRVIIGPYEFQAETLGETRDEDFVPPLHAPDITSIHLPGFDDVDLDVDSDIDFDPNAEVHASRPGDEHWANQTLNPQSDRPHGPGPKSFGHLLDEGPIGPASPQGGLMDAFLDSENDSPQRFPSPLDIDRRGPGLDEAYRPEPVARGGRSRSASTSNARLSDFNPEDEFPRPNSSNGESGDDVEDWREPKPVGVAPTPRPPRAERRPAVHQADHRTSQEFEPADTDDAYDDEHVKPPRRTSPTRAGESVQEYEAAWRLFAESAGADFAQIHGVADPKAQIALMGRAFRLMAEGLADLLKSRALAKREHRVDMTVSNASDNNPLKLLGRDAVVQQLLGRPAPGFLTLEQSVEEGYTDLIEHEAATVAGIDAALRALVRKFDPDALEKRFSNEAGSGLFGKVNFSVRAWERYRYFYDDRARRVDDNFNELWGEEFRHAYESYTAQQEQRRHPGKQRHEFPSPKHRR